MSQVLVVADCSGDALNAATRATISAAKALGEVTLLIASDATEALAKDASTLEGVVKVLCAKQPCFAHPLAEDISALVLSLADDYQAILAPATTFGKNCLPRIAAQLDVAQISDMCEVVNQDTFIRPIYAGNALQTVQSADDKKVITVRATAFPLAAQGQATAPIETLTYNSTHQLSRFVDAQVTQADRPQLDTASIVVSGGRGLQNADNFHLIESLADRMKAAVGASRAAVDAGFVSNDFQVGQTGKIIAPDLYWAIGISGAIQHIAGIKDSKVIVAINKDPDAPIFEVADYGLVADFFEVLPELEAALDQLGYEKK